MRPIAAIERAHNDPSRLPKNRNALLTDPRLKGLVGNYAALAQAITDLQAGLLWWDLISRLCPKANCSLRTPIGGFVPR